MSGSQQERKSVSILKEHDKEKIESECNVIS